MSEQKAQPGMGLGDTGFDPDILTKEIDHDFFDNPCISDMVAETEPRVYNLSSRQEINDRKCQFGGIVLPNKFAASEPGCSNGVRLDKSIRSKHYEEGHQSGSQESEVDVVDHQSSGRSSDVTVHLEMEKEGNSAAASRFYSIQSNATSPNYPRPKQCYLLQQRKRSLHSFKKCEGFLTNSANQFTPMNANDCGLTANPDDDLSDSSNNSSTTSELDLYDFSESSDSDVDSEDEELRILQENFEYPSDNDDSSCSDLTEVSPLSSAATSPLPPPPQFITEFQNGDINLETEHLCSAADGLHICHDVSSIQSQLNEMDNIEALVGAARFPLIISGAETGAIPNENSCQDPNGGDPEEGNTLQGDEQKQGICIDCCFESAKKILSRDSSPSRKEFLPIAEDEERSTSSYSANSFSVSIPRDGSSRSSSSAWSATNLKTGVIASIGKARASSSGSGSTSSFGSGGKRHSRNYSFTNDQVKKIERENQILLRKILDTHKAQHPHHHHQPGRSNCHRIGHHHKTTTTSTSIARLRHQRRIKCENELLMKRLQSVKPSKSIEDAFKDMPN